MSTQPQPPKPPTDSERVVKVKLVDIDVPIGVWFVELFKVLAVLFVFSLLAGGLWVAVGAVFQ